MNFTRVNLLCLLLGLSSSVPAAEVTFAKVTHAPAQPRSGEAVRVTAEASSPPGPTAPVLEYQIVEPGQYIERADPAYAKQWAAIPMTAMGGGAGAAKGTTAYTADVAGSQQRHRRLVRYRIVVDGRVVAPAPGDAQPNFGYFVYDGVPEWRAAIDPNSTVPAWRNPVTFSAAVMNSVQVYHFLAKKSSVENTTWYAPTSVRDDQARHQYQYTGTLVVNGTVYDHIRFRARGGEWRYAMGKNMWKFDFQRGHHLQARDDFGRPYTAKWEKLNLGACIQQGNYHRRGEHGLFEAVTFRLFNLAGVPAPLTHYVHLRIVDEAAEAPASQYEGDFWGLYLATEEIDGRFLEQHGLPDGNIYKWDFGRPKTEHVAAGAVTNRSDVLQFVAAYERPQADAWWRQHVDLARYFSYRSMLECVHHYDIGSGKNYFYYHDTPAGRWIVLPWDTDLTWKNNMYGDGQEPFARAGVLRREAFQIEYRNRLRELRDLLFNPEQTCALIEEFAAVISDPAGGASFVDADRAKWDHHPIMTSRWVHPAKAGAGQYYLESPTKDFRGMVQLMKNYVNIRGRWCDTQLLTEPALPPLPSVTAIGATDLKQERWKFHATFPAGEPAPAKLQWRLAEVTIAPTTTRPLRPRHYEVEALWQQEGSSTIEIPTRNLASGWTFRVRARACAADGRCGHWSAPVEITP